MAITIDDQPYEYTPVGQRLMLVASSTNVANAGFRFVFDFGSFQVNVQPNAADKGMLDLAPIFREQLQHDFNLTGTPFSTIESMSVAFISCTIKEGWLIDGVFTVSGAGMADIDDVYAFLAEYQVSDGYKPNPNLRYALSETTKYAMSERTIDTHKWSEAAARGLSNDFVYIPTRLSDYGVLYAPSATALLADNDFDIAVLTSYDNNNTIIDTIALSVTSSSFSVNVIPAFYGNVSNTALDLTGAKYYTLIFGKESLFPIYDPRSYLYCFYIVADDCCFDNVRLGWTNTCGGIDYFNFTKKSELSFNYDRKQYQKVVGSYNTATFDFNTYDRGATDRYVTTTKGLQINSDWISVGEFNLLQTLCRSNDVFIINDDGTLTPVLVDTQNFVIKDERYSKLYNVTLNLKYSQPVGL